MWWESLSSLQQVMFIIATVATALMIILIIMMLIGMDHGEAFDGDVGGDMDLHMDDTDVDSGDFDHDADVFNHESFFSIGGLKIVTIRGVLAFLSIGGWVVYLMAESSPIWLALLVGFICGSAAAVLLAYAMRAIFRLESSGNLDYGTAVGKIAIVYIRIPKSGSGQGKVMFTHQGKMVEVDAITKDSEDILTKKEVKIVGLENETTLIVKSTAKKE